MAEYVKREDVMNTFLHYGIGWGAAKVKGVINSIPSADVVERKRGKWIKKRIDHKFVNGFLTEYKTVCSVCGKEAFNDTELGVRLTNYCHNCGAWMESEDK